MSDEPLDVMFFCLGNICRSPLAEALFCHRIEQQGLEDAFRVESSGTSAYHVGESPDPGSQNVARERLGRDISHQRSQQLTADHLETFDYLVAMDQSNRQRAIERAPADVDQKLFLMRDFDPEAGGDLNVPDPYGAGQSQFGLVFDIVDRSTAEFLDFLLREHDRLRS
jgi:protein-tyrosine phosphatase